MKGWKGASRLGAMVVAMALGLAACTSGSGQQAVPSELAGLPEDQLIRVGYVAVGPEGGWREANEADIMRVFSRENGFDLEYAPSTNGSHTSQVNAFHIFLDNEDVDIILLAPVQSEAWDQPLVRAQIAKVPVILLDRGVDAKGENLYATRIAPDNRAVAAAAAEWALSEYPGGATYFTLEGPAGASVVNERNEGWDSIMSQHPEFVEVGAQTANWSLTEATAVFAEALAASGNSIDLVFAHNDEMGLGAAEAIEAAGLVPGQDVKIITIDGTFAALNALSEGRLSFVAEYNPLFGKIALETVRKVLRGEEVDKEIVVPSATFRTPEEAWDALPSRVY